MGTKEKHRKLSDVYGESDGTTIFDEEIYSARKAVLRCRKPELGRMISSYVKNNGGVFDEEDLSRAVSELDEPTYRDVSTIPSHAVVACADLLLSGTPDQRRKDELFDSLRFLCDVDFTRLFSLCSPAEKVLADDPVFMKSDDETRNIARRNVEKFAKKNSVSEEDAAKMLLLADKLFVRDVPKSGRLYFPLMMFFTLCLAVLCGVLTQSVFVALSCIVCLSEPVKLALDYVFSRTLGAAGIPKLRLDSVPDEGATLVVTTTLLFGGKADEELFSRMEQCYVSSRDKNVRVGILADLKESKTRTTDADEKIVSGAVAAFERLNKKNGDKFYLFVRGREFAPTEGKYMGRERKRGAVCDLVRFIKGDDVDFAVFRGDKDFLSRVKYVITLDSDTRMHPGAALEMIGAMMHPANRPKIKNGVVTSGYGIMQPRTDTGLSSAVRTPFSVMLCGAGGTDIYGGAAYDTYGTLFGHGAFCGKGIFDVSVFYDTIIGAFPHGRILSHDILEGSRMRTGALTDVALVDNVPKNAMSYFSRMHRWIRGDVQNMAFAGKFVRNEKGERVENPIGDTSRFMLWENIRRSLVPVSSVVTILLALSIGLSKRQADFALLFSVLYLILPFAVALITLFYHAGRRFFSTVLPESMRSFLYMLYGVSSLFHTACVTVDAYVRALFSMHVTKRNFLVWTTSSEADGRREGLVSYIARSAPSVAAGVLLMRFASGAIFKTVGFLWLVFPLAMYLCGREYRRKVSVTRSEKAVLIKYASDIWRYFSDCVNKNENYLPPDNVRLSPSPATAHMTSPTNIGLYMLSCLAARDFGFIDSNELAYRLSHTVKTIKALPKQYGHLFNWYDAERAEVVGNPYVSTVDSGNFVTCLVALSRGLREYENECAELSDIARDIDEIVSDTDFSVLYDKRKGLFTIGVNVSEMRRDAGYYDIFMSECRTTSYYAVSRGVVPRSHWGRLQRLVLGSDGFIGLASWSGTMFEYLMPALLLPAKQGSLSYESLEFAVREQRKASVNGVWGRSESAYHVFDSSMNYGYKAFGAPSLSLRHTPVSERVIAPYASFLSLCIAPHASLENLGRLKKMSMYGKYGFYEAIDFTASRAPSSGAVVRQYMSHHMGMSLIAAANACFDSVFVRRFMSDPDMKASEDLLEERIPVDAHIARGGKRKVGIAHVSARPAGVRGSRRQSRKNDGSHVRASIISNGSCGAVCSSRGGVLLFDQKKHLCVDPFTFGELHGVHVLLRCGPAVYDLLRGDMSRSELEPYVKYVKDTPRLHAETTISVCGDYKCFDIHVSAEGEFSDACPMLYFEPSLGDPGARLSHPAFEDLRVESFYDPDLCAILYRRRARAPSEKETWLCVSLEGGGDEAMYACRRDDILDPMYGDTDLKRLLLKDFRLHTGALVNPVCAIKKTSPAHGRYECDFLIVTGSGRDEASEVLINQRRGKSGESLTRRFVSSCRAVTEERMYSCGLSRTDEKYVSLLLCAILGLTRRRGKAYFGVSDISELWSVGISGDSPILCVELAEREPSPTVLRILRGFVGAYKYISVAGIKCELAILYDSGDTYFDKCRDTINNILIELGCEYMRGRRDGIFVLPSPSCRDILVASSCFAAKIDQKTGEFELLHEFAHEIAHEDGIVTRPLREPEEIKNPIARCGCGAFVKDGFAIRKTASAPKRPWSFIYAGPSFGTLVTQNSLGYTWFLNSREKRITAYNPDALLDLSSERLIAELDGRKYDLCACASNVLYSTDCAIYEGAIGDIPYKVCVGVDIKLPVKLVYVKISGDVKLEYRTVAVMGDLERNPSRVNAEISGDTTFYKNRLGGGFAGFTGFLSRIDSKDEHAFLLGAYGPHGEETFEAIRREYAKPSDLFYGFDEYGEYYDKLLSSVCVRSGSAVRDLMMNRYLPYQCIAGRIFGRTGFWQSGGAYGFRDQLQDMLCAMKYDASLARTHILRCCAHQYTEGDVMHWWHPAGSSCKGVRTLCSDDYLWLPYVAAEYAKRTGDYDLFDVCVPYTESEPLSYGEHDRYEVPRVSRYRESVYLHCARALEHGMKYGEHGLPLIGSGDWNDGMNAVGTKGRGESVWLGFFLCRVLRDFIPICEKRSDSDGAEKYRAELERLEAACIASFERDRFLRAFYDDGTPLGSEDSSACRIDLLPQAFSAISGVGGDLSRIAMDTAYDRLYDRESGIFKLFDPPFPASDTHDPGYIRGYADGVRENGGQYTHAAVWGARALILVGRPDRTEEVLRNLDPAEICLDPERMEKYGGEPYFMAGDVYSAQGSIGRCGWSLYTGAAGWYHSVVLEDVIGYREHDGGFSIMPNKALIGRGIGIRVRKYGTDFKILARPAEKSCILLDGKVSENFFPFDKKIHLIEIAVEK